MRCKLGWAAVMAIACTAGQSQGALLTTGLEIHYEAGQHTYQAIDKSASAIVGTALDAIGLPAGEGDPVDGVFNLAAGNFSPPLQTGATNRRPIRLLVDGTPVLRFDGANDNLLGLNLPEYYQAGGITSLDDQTYSWVVGFRTSTANQADRTIMQVYNNTAPVTNTVRVALSGGNLNIEIDPDAGGVNTGGTLSTPEIIDDWVIVSVIRNGATVDAYVNGASIGTLAGLAGVADFDSIRFGASNGNGTAGAFAGDIFIALGYGQALTTSERLQVENYVVSMIPEPSSVALFGMACCGFANYVRRRKA